MRPRHDHRRARRAARTRARRRLDASADVLEKAESLGSAAPSSWSATHTRSPFETDSFDIVHAHQTLQHLGDPVAALREMRRVVAARRRRRGPRRRLRRHDLVPADPGARRLAGAVRADPPLQRRRARRRPAVEGLGARRRVRGGRDQRIRLELRDRRRPSVVGRTVGRPRAGVAVRSGRSRAWLRHPRRVGAHQPRDGANGPRRQTAGWRCRTARFLPAARAQRRRCKDSVAKI